MAQELKIFDNPNFGEIRTIINEDGKLFFVASDVAKALGYAVPQKAVIDHCKHCSKMEHPTNKGTYINIIPESDVYRLSMKSKLPNAEQFQDWVCEDVLTSISKTGQYSLNLPSYQISDPIKRAEKWIEEEKQRQQLAIDNQKKAEKIEQDKPKVIFADAVSTSQRSCLIAELAKILKQNGVDMGQNRLFDWLRKHGYLCSRGQYYNQPTQRAQELGLFEIKQTTINKPDGSILVSTTTKVTGKGQIYFVNKFLNDSNVGRAAV